MYAHAKLRIYPDRVCSDQLESPEVRESCGVDLQVKAGRKRATAQDGIASGRVGIRIAGKLSLDSILVLRLQRVSAEFVNLRESLLRRSYVAREIDGSVPQDGATGIEIYELRAYDAYLGPIVGKLNERVEFIQEILENNILYGTK